MEKIRARLEIDDSLVPRAPPRVYAAFLHMRGLSHSQVSAKVCEVYNLKNFQATQTLRAVAAMENLLPSFGKGCCTLR
jgi:hypothetical protein